MKTHFEHLLDSVPDLKQRKILDLGSGRGSFLIQCAQNGAMAEGLELNKDYIKKSYERAKEANVTIKVTEGVGETLPYADSSFDFVNMCEVIEHVERPKSVLAEIYRVLKPGGEVYVSVPNRFSLKDQHFHLYFVNWMPRSWSDKFISIFGKHKDYKGDTGFQSLSEMHYYTYGQLTELFKKHNFSIMDIRLLKIKKNFKGFKYYSAFFAYYLLRSWYFDSFHLLLYKSS